MIQFAFNYNTGGNQCSVPLLLYLFISLCAEYPLLLYLIIYLSIYLSTYTPARLLNTSVCFYIPLRLFIYTRTMREKKNNVAIYYGAKPH